MDCYINITISCKYLTQLVLLLRVCCVRLFLYNSSYFCVSLFCSLCSWFWDGWKREWTSTSRCLNWGCKWWSDVGWGCNFLGVEVFFGIVYNTDDCISISDFMITFLDNNSFCNKVKSCLFFSQQSVYPFFKVIWNRFSFVSQDWNLTVYIAFDCI